ncbi:uncharacterized protein A1O5_03544 [Cladophialophora psammophila CBS 110553]|uniref:Uncharacterized protein n=1 Tax=Cladophialophora psammophila CBS 110553 TaxID=1182543 RepID=W9WZY8_9EURO|nr:uncharacterized protein A1O5_03544 [Cladophialophora psammophila CBS 110553]EXJ73782.1 hypothetical protein A1O5_03544 [Cladophialophora psammophila CBS 110553]
MSQESGDHGTALQLKSPDEKQKLHQTGPGDVCQDSAFLNAFPEVRLLIYKIFTDPQHEDRLNADRKNLLLICQKITAEWAPLFYRSTNVLANPPKPGIVPRRRWGLGERYSPHQFDNLFLKNLAEYKLKNIRRIEFEPCTQFGERLGHPIRHIGMQGIFTCPDSVNWNETNVLLNILYEYRDQLQSLQEVTMRNTFVDPVRYWRKISMYETPDAPSRPMARRVWRALTRDGSFDQLAKEWQEWQVRERSGICKDWDVHKVVDATVRVADQPEDRDAFFDRYDIPPELNDGRHEAGYCYTIVSVRVVFKKRIVSAENGTAAPKPTPADQIIPRVIVKLEEKSPEN